MLIGGGLVYIEASPELLGSLRVEMLRKKTPPIYLGGEKFTTMKKLTKKIYYKYSKLF